MTVNVTTIAKQRRAHLAEPWAELDVLRGMATL
jgi:hypothetical protein